MSIGICRKTTLIIVLFLSFSLVCLGAGRKFTLVIDAGHGGHDSGKGHQSACCIDVGKVHY